MPKIILVTGSNGQLGREIQQLAKSFKEFDFRFTGRNDLDISDKRAVEHYCETNRIEVIINCAAYTAVDKAEADPLTAEICNHISVKYLAEISKEKNISLIHISTDYVFNGQNYQPYKETDATDPKNIYGKTKCDGEKAILAVKPKNSIIIRTSWVYSAYGQNFVKTMLRLGKERENIDIIFDQIGTPTYAKDLGQAILDIVPQLNNNHVEVFHYSNEGVSSWFDFANTIFEIENISCCINPIETKSYPTPAIRPYYGLLDKTKIKQTYGIHIPYWKNSLTACLSKMRETQS